MSYLIDTNIFLRLAQRNDPLRPVVLKALQQLKQQNEDLCYTTQVLVEFWNVCTRPRTSRGGLELTVEATERKAKLIEQRFRLLPESLVTHQEWLRLVTLHNVKGVEVHDTMLAAVMNTYEISHLLTFNSSDFKRFSGITSVNPADVI